jgi:hypothetical protein
MSYHDGNRKLQDAIRAYLAANLTSYAAGVAKDLPRLVGGDFDNLGQDHLIIYVPEMNEDPPYSGTYAATVIARIATKRDTAIATHRNYCKAIFDLLCDAGLPGYVNALSGVKIRINQIIEGRSFQIGNVNESMRHDTLTLQVRIYQVT